MTYWRLILSSKITTRAYHNQVCTYLLFRCLCRILHLLSFFFFFFLFSPLILYNHVNVCVILGGIFTIYLKDFVQYSQPKLYDIDVSGQGKRESLVILLDSILEFLWISSSLSFLLPSLPFSCYLNFVDSNSCFAGWLLKISLRKVPFMKL